MDCYQLCLESNPKRTDIDLLVNNLVAYNNSKAEKEEGHPLAVFIRNQKNIIMGGLNGYTHWGWLFISHLWLEEQMRNQGYGARLVKAAEKEAWNRSCHHAHVDTFDFQALGFYQSLGYEIFGVLDDFPRGHQRFYLKKNMNARAR